MTSPADGDSPPPRAYLFLPMISTQTQERRRTRRLTLPPRPRVSVIIPCYNYGRFLREAVASATGQTLGNIEIIIVDDGSTDNTPEVIQSLDDRRIRSRRIPNCGVSAARNAGLNMARGEFIAFLDANDRWHPDKLERQVAVMDAEPDVAMVFSDLRRFSEEDPSVEETQFALVREFSTLPTRPARGGDGFVIEGDPFITLGPLPQLPAWIQTDLFRASRVRDLRFSERLTLAEDLHYIMRAYLRGPVGYVADQLVEVRRHDSNSYQRHDEMLVPVIDSLRMLQRETMRWPQRRALDLRLAQAWMALGYRDTSGAAT
jgi:glycosyltransferase involved in cell wall biosynthesis